MKGKGGYRKEVSRSVTLLNISVIESVGMYRSGASVLIFQPKLHLNEAELYIVTQTTLGLGRTWVASLVFNRYMTSSKLIVHFRILVSSPKQWWFRKVSNYNRDH